MPTLPNSAIAFLLVFAPLFSVPVWEHVQMLITGAILCQGGRTVTAILRMMGLDQKASFCKYHSVLSRAKWSGLQGSKILLGLLVPLLLTAGLPIVILVDETIERRKGVKITAVRRINVRWIRSDSNNPPQTEVQTDPHRGFSS